MVGSLSQFFREAFSVVVSLKSVSSMKRYVSEILSFSFSLRQIVMKRITEGIQTLASASSSLTKRFREFSSFIERLSYNMYVVIFQNNVVLSYSLNFISSFRRRLQESVKLGETKMYTLIKIFFDRVHYTVSLVNIPHYLQEFSERLKFSVITGAVFTIRFLNWMVLAERMVRNYLFDVRNIIITSERVINITTSILREIPFFLSDRIERLNYRMREYFKVVETSFAPFKYVILKMVIVASAHSYFMMKRHLLTALQIIGAPQLYFTLKKHIQRTFQIIGKSSVALSVKKTLEAMYNLLLSIIGSSQ
jgi:hypothetical protein